jgi:hypothetical protein
VFFQSQQRTSDTGMVRIYTGINTWLTETRNSSTSAAAAARSSRESIFLYCWTVGMPLGITLVCDPCAFLWDGHYPAWSSWALLWKVLDGEMLVRLAVFNVRYHGQHLFIGSTTMSGDTQKRWRCPSLPTPMVHCVTCENLVHT